MKYEVDPLHNTYQSDGYNYLQPFPNVRFTYKLNDRNKVSAFFKERKIDFCINCAAYTAVDLAEENKEIANKIIEDSKKEDDNKMQ